MRRTQAALLLAVLVGAAAPAAEAAKLTARTPRQQTYFMVPALARQCALSTDASFTHPTTGCRDDSAGVQREVLGGAPLEVPALDGVPLKLDVSRKITGKIEVESTYLWGYLGAYGTGRPQLRAGVVGLADGKEVAVGVTTTDPWTITPLETEHVVEFEIEADPALAGVELHELTLELEIIGLSAGHDLFSADGQSTLTVPLAGSPRRT